MDRATVSLVEFYVNVLPAAAEVGYKIVLTALVREADAPGFYKDVKRDWSSLHDATGPDMLFVFAGANAKLIPTRYDSGLRDKRRPVVYQSDSVAMTGVDSWRMRWNSRPVFPYGAEPLVHDTLRIGKPYLVSQDDDITRDHTLEVNALRRHLRIREAYLPCFVFTLLPPRGPWDRIIVPLATLANRSTYAFIKSLSGACEGYFGDIDQSRVARNELEKALQSARKRERQRFAETSRAIRGLSSVRMAVERASEGLSSTVAKEAVAEILAICARPGRSGVERAKCFQHLQAVRGEHQRQDGIVPLLQRLIDWAFLPRVLLAPAPERFWDDHRRDAENVRAIEAETERLLQLEGEIWTRLRTLIQGYRMRKIGATVPGKLEAQAVHVGVIVALHEEVRELLLLAGTYAPCNDGGMNSYMFTRGRFSCVVTVVGAMGETEAARVTERHIALFNPESVVSVGISGGVHDDLRVGDVYIPRQVVQYIQDSKAAPMEAGGFFLQPGAPASRADDRLHTVAYGFELNKAEAYAAWRVEACEDLRAQVADAEVRGRLVAEGLVRSDVVVLADGHEASGPVVSAASAFSAWIRDYDRNVKAVDMESAAVLRASEAREDRRRCLVIRGISDYGDLRKKELDAVGGGSLRRYAMRNAVRFLFALLDAGAWC